MAGPAPSWRGRRIAALTSLRFFAAIGIVLAHYSSTLTLPNQTASHALVALAGSTVPLFFILSGFVLTLQYDAAFGADASSALQRYVRARVARIVPLYWLALALTAAAYLATDFRVSLGGDAHSVGKFTSFVLSVFALQAWVPSTSVQQFWNAPGWSVSAEVFFYALLPLLLGTGGRWLSGSARSVATVLALGWVASGAYFIAVRVAAPGDVDWVGYGVRLPLLGLPAFMLGIALARRHMARPQHRGWWGSAMWPALLLPVSALCLVDPKAPFEQGWLLTQWVWVPLFGWLVWTLADEQRRTSRWLAARWLVLLGDSSYALYLIHWLPLGFVLRGYLGAPTPWLGPTVIVALVLASVLLHRHFEEPLRRWFIRSASPNANTP